MEKNKVCIARHLLTGLGVVAVIVILCLGYWSIKIDHNKDIEEMMEKQFFYLEPDVKDPYAARSYHTPKIGEEVYLDGKYYIINNVVYDLEKNRLNVYCALEGTAPAP